MHNKNGAGKHWHGWGANVYHSGNLKEHPPNVKYNIYVGIKYKEKIQVLRWRVACDDRTLSSLSTRHTRHPSSTWKTHDFHVACDVSRVTRTLSHPYSTPHPPPPSTGHTTHHTPHAPFSSTALCILAFGTPATNRLSEISANIIAKTVPATGCMRAKKTIWRIIAGMFLPKTFWR